MTMDVSVLNSASTWFEHLSRVKAPALRMFCFPYAGGSADVYRSWQRWVPGQLDVCLVHLPGRGRNIKQPAFTRIIPLVKELADRLDHKTRIPYVLYGHSMGALISFELSRELFRRHGNGPKHLFVSGRVAPQWPPDEITFNLPDDKFLDKLEELNGTPREVLDNPELMQIFLNILRADFETVETYEYHQGEPLPCPITVYGGLQDEHVPSESCHAWGKQTSAGYKVRMFKGDHFFIRNPGPEFITAFQRDLLRAVSTLDAGNLKQWPSK